MSEKFNSLEKFAPPKTEDVIYPAIYTALGNGVEGHPDETYDNYDGIDKRVHDKQEQGAGEGGGNPVVSNNNGHNDPLQNLREKYGVESSPVAEPSPNDANELGDGDSKF